jgi:hypothetical protein
MSYAQNLPPTEPGNKLRHSDFTSGTISSTLIRHGGRHQQGARSTKFALATASQDRTKARDPRRTFARIPPTRTTLTVNPLSSSLRGRPKPATPS